jgi:hypothetical protein
VCASLCAVLIGIRKEPHELVLVRRQTKASGILNTFLIAMIRAAPPPKTKKEYDERVDWMLSEYAYRNGREWGRMHPALLTDEGCYECAGMASDFACYMFDSRFHGGTVYKNADEIRSGDIVHIKGHYFSVLRRNGQELLTIEGNLNGTVRHSNRRYSVKNGDVWCGGKPVQFDYGRHLCEPFE